MSGGIGAAIDALREPVKSSQQSAFLSDFTVGELILLEELGYEAVDIVFGAGSASWYPQFTTAGTEGAMWAHAIVTAIGEARSVVLSELSRRRAAGVVAMRIALEREPANLLTCTMLGTAVRRRRAHHVSERPVTEQSVAEQPVADQRVTERPVTEQPFTTSLSARDFHLLTRAGYRPVGMVLGASVIGFNARSASQALGLSRENVELEGQTNALYSAREKAMEMMERECTALGADGVVAVELMERPFNTVLTHAVELIVYGTAVRRGPEGHKNVAPKLQLSLDDPPPSTFEHG